jgi:hypothetical protein
MAGCAPFGGSPAAEQQAVSNGGIDISQEPMMMAARPPEWVLDKFTDLPVPEEFKLDLDDSFVFVQGDLRSVDLTYEGERPVRELVHFYKESMPGNGWMFIRMTGKTLKMLTFAKRNELCEIIIKPPRSQTGHVELHNQDHGESEERFLTQLNIKLNPYHRRG